MPKFSKSSAAKLAGCHPDLQKLFNNVVMHRDCKILQGQRSIEEQEQLFSEGKSKVTRGKHNEKPSMAIDVVPWPQPDWEDTRAFDHFGGVVRGFALVLGINIRWGGDWDGDSDLNDQKFNDLVHFELVVK